MENKIFLQTNTMFLFVKIFNLDKNYYQFNWLDYYIKKILFNRNLAFNYFKGFA